MDALPSPEQFAARVRAAADGEGRLPLPAQAGWDIFPFEPASLRVRPLEPAVQPEPPRGGEGGRPCRACAADGVVWSSERWVLTGRGEPTGLPLEATLLLRAHLDLRDLDDVHAAELGQLVVRVDRAAEPESTAALRHVALALERWGGATTGSAPGAATPASAATGAADPKSTHASTCVLSAPRVNTPRTNPLHSCVTTSTSGSCVDGASGLSSSTLQHQRPGRAPGPGSPSSARRLHG